MHGQLTRASPMFHVTTRILMLSLSMTVPGEICGESIPPVAGDVFARLRPNEPASLAVGSPVEDEWLLNSACSLDRTFASPEETSAR